MDGLFFDIDKRVVDHYKYRLQILLENKENKEFKPILKKQLEKMLKLLEEMYQCFEQYNVEQRKQQ